MFRLPLGGPFLKPIELQLLGPDVALIRDSFWETGKPMAEGGGPRPAREGSVKCNNVFKQAGIPCNRKWLTDGMNHGTLT